MRYGCCILITPLDLLLNPECDQVHSLLDLFVAYRINDRFLPTGIGIVRDPTFIKIMDPKAGASSSAPALQSSCQIHSRRRETTISLPVLSDR